MSAGSAVTRGLDGVRGIVGQHGEEAGVVDVGQIGLQAVPRHGGEIAGRRRPRLYLGWVDEDFELEVGAAALLDHHAAVRRRSNQRTWLHDRASTSLGITPLLS